MHLEFGAFYVIYGRSGSDFERRSRLRYGGWNKKFWSLMYADDMVLAASKEELESMISRLEKYLDK